MRRDNTPTERFFRSFKTGCWEALLRKTSNSEVPKTRYDDLAQARVDVASYIVGYYSQVRPHSFSDHLTLVEKEIQFFNQSLLKAF